jgi:hypothetical protein
MIWQARSRKIGSVQETFNRNPFLLPKKPNKRCIHFPLTESSKSTGEAYKASIRGVFSAAKIIPISLVMGLKWTLNIEAELSTQKIS